MDILDLKQATDKGRASRGLVLIQRKPELRSRMHGDDFMLGDFYFEGHTVPFRIWEKDIYGIIEEYGPGIYAVETRGDEYRGKKQLTVNDVDLYAGDEITAHDFLGSIPRKKLIGDLAEVKQQLTDLGVSDTCWDLVNVAITHPLLEDRYLIEGAAVKHHDNVFGGLSNHTTKMLRILIALFKNNPELRASADLLTFSVFMHDIGKVFEYRDLDVSEYWYANHRVRGIEFLADIRDEVLSRFDEAFYRQVQAVIAGHHGEDGDRPTTVATTIVHYIDLLESQVTNLVSRQLETTDGKIFHSDFGVLQGLPAIDAPDDPS
jgi:23S rRNA maturation-related 3'-5' exoribonuclease YhaM